MASLAGIGAQRGQKVRRTRPDGGGIVWHEALHAFHCEACEEWEEIHKRSDRTPERLRELKEFLIVEHTECWQFDDPEMARNARRYRKEKKRRENLERRRVSGLASQRVSWRGRS